MSIAGTRGYVSLGYQAAKGTAATSANKKRIYAFEENFAPQEMIDSLPIELSGKLFPNHTYKNGVYGAGTMRLSPRLGDSIGYLLYGTTGVHTVAPTGNASYKHTFKVDDTNQANLPWCTFERYVPDSTGTQGFQERFEDARIVTTSFTYGNVGPALCEVGAISRKAGVAVDDETNSPIVSALDTGDTLAMSCAGSFTSSITELSAAKFMQVQIVNTIQYTQPNDAQVFGSYYLEDLVALGRSGTVRLIANLDDKHLYQKLVYGGTGVQSWTPVVTTGDLSITIASAGNMSGETIPYSAKFSAPNVKFVAGRMALSPAKLVRLEIMAQINNSATSTPTYSWDVTNQVASYTFS